MATSNTAPTTPEYQAKVRALITQLEGYRLNIYLDGQGLLTAGVGLLLVNAKNEIQADNVASLRAVLSTANQTTLDSMVQVFAKTGNSVSKLEDYFDMETRAGRTTLVSYTEKKPDGTPQNISIDSLIPSNDKAWTASLNAIAEKENNIDRIFLPKIRSLVPNYVLTDDQRLALLSRFFNGFISSASTALANAVAANDPVSAFKAFTASRGPAGAISRSMDEFSQFWGADRVTSEDLGRDGKFIRVVDGSGTN